MHTVSHLITTFVPDHYTLSLALERKKRTFNGLVTIHGSTTTKSTTILVHAKELDIDSVLVDGKTASFSLGENDEVTISHPDIHAGKHIVAIQFRGTITDGMHGLYPCYYEHDGIKKELLATQFESHHAREVFPCIDEPEAKATFDLTLTTEQGVTVLGNMPIKTQRVENNQLLTIFNTTPRMSTYLLAWVVGELHKKTAKTKDGVEVNVWATPPQKPDSLDFALTHAVKTIEFFNDYFGTPYPLPKSDHVALPDFSSGAMENWGLITYREVALLADPATTGITSKQYIAKVVAHELSHQWFGNLVTMKWWNNLWLNESFANLMEYIAVDALYPEWNIWLDFSTHENIPALRRDAIDGVQAVQVDVNHPDEIGTLFDGAIVYSKGSRLLRMLQHYIGSSAFQTGLKQYFTDYAYKNTEADDLWRALGKASGHDIASLMNNWISQPGYPVVALTENDNSITLTQEQFFIGPHHESSRLWPIPLDSSNPAMTRLFTAKEVSILLENTESLYVNQNDSAHFITNYSPSQRQAIVEKITHGQLPTVNRLQFLHEQTLLARGGVISSATLVPLLDAYKNETDEPVWDIVSLALSELKKFVEDNKDSERKLKDLTIQLAQKQYQRLGWSPQPGENEADTKLRATIIGMMLYGEDKNAIKTAIDLFESTKLEELDAELRPLIIGAAVRHGNKPETIPNLIKQYQDTSLGDLEIDIVSGLTATRSVKNIEQLLGLVKDNTLVRPQDVFRWVMYLLRNRDGRQITWEWLQNNWPWIKETFGSDKSYDYFPRLAGSALRTRTQLEEYRAFFVPMRKEPALTRVITLGISEIEGRVELLERDTKAVENALLTLID